MSFGGQSEVYVFFLHPRVSPLKSSGTEVCISALPFLIYGKQVIDFKQHHFALILHFKISNLLKPSKQQYEAQVLRASSSEITLASLPAGLPPGPLRWIASINIRSARPEEALGLNFEISNGNGHMYLRMYEWEALFWVERPEKLQKSREEHAVSKWIPQV